MTKHVRTLGVLCLGVALAGCQGIPGLFGPVAGGPGGDSPFPDSGLVANNAASLSGRVFAPSSLVANNSASLIGNNSASLIGNNSAALVSNNAAAYRTAAVQELPVIKAVVEAVRDGQVIAKATTDDTGRYTLPNLPREKAFLVRASFTLDGQKFQELAIAKTFTQQSDHRVNSASTLVTAKVVKQGTALDQVNMTKYNDTVNLVAAAQTSIQPSDLTSTDNSAYAFEQIAESNEVVSETYTEAITPTTTAPSPTPSPTATPVTYSPKEYFFPPSGTARGEFRRTVTQGAQVATSSYSIRVTAYSLSEATLRQTLDGFDFDSVLQVSGSVVKVGTPTEQGPVFTMTLGTPVFTAEGTIVTPAGASDPVTYKLVAASEQVTVPAGTYTCVRLLETTGTGASQTQRTVWYAKGIGIAPVKVLSSTQNGGTTTTTETVMTSFTP